MRKYCFDCYCKECSPLPPDVRASTKKASHLHRRGHELFVNKVTLQFLRNAFFLDNHFWSRSAIFSPPIYNRESIVQHKKCFLLPPDAQPQRGMRDICFVEYIILLLMRCKMAVLRKLLPWYILSLLESLCHIPPLPAIHNIVSTVQQTVYCNISITEYYRQSSVLRASYKK